MSATQPRVAVVDDEEPVRKALRRLLRSAGLVVQTYASGQEFLEDLAEQQPDCVVLDIRMPHMSGYDVLARMTAAHVICPVIFITALDEPGDRDTAIQSGAFGFFHKPFDGQALIDCIGAAMAARHTGGKRDSSTRTNAN